MCVGYICEKNGKKQRKSFYYLKNEKSRIKKQVRIFFLVLIFKTSSNK